MKSLEIRAVEDDFDAKRLGEFMVEQPQYYPDFKEWVYGTCLPRIEEGTAKALLVVQDGTIAGNVVYRRLPEPNTVRINNFRIDQGYRKRSIGYFLLQQAVHVIKTSLFTDQEKVRITTDVSTPNFSGVEFFIRNGFDIIGIQELYIPGQMEYMFEKTI